MADDGPLKLMYLNPSARPTTTGHLPTWRAT